MEYDVTFLKELRGLGEYIKSLDGADKIIRTVERCIEIKRELSRLEKRCKSSNGNRATERKKLKLIEELLVLCHCGNADTRAVRETLVCYTYFVDSLKMDYQRTIGLY